MSQVEEIERPHAFVHFFVQMVKLDNMYTFICKILVITYYRVVLNTQYVGRSVR